MSKLRKGDRVHIIGSSHHYKCDKSFIGCTGTVMNVYGPTNVVVEIDGNSEDINKVWTTYYFREEDLAKMVMDPLIETYKDPTEELIKHDGYWVATVRYINNPNFIVKAALYDQSINIGDLCVVHTANSGDLVAQIIDVAYTETEVSSEVVCPVDYTEYHKRKAYRERKAELVQLMSQKAGQMDIMQLFDMLASCDGDIAQLLSEYKELEGAK